MEITAAMNTMIIIIVRIILAPEQGRQSWGLGVEILGRGVEGIAGGHGGRARVVKYYAQKQWRI